LVKSSNMCSTTRLEHLLNIRNFSVNPTLKVGMRVAPTGYGELRADAD